MKPKDALAEFWGDIIGGIFPVPTTIEASRPASASLKNLESESIKLKADEINAIRAQANKGFRVIDIDPNLTTKDEFPFLYKASTVARLFGEDDTLYSFPIAGTLRVDSATVNTSGSGYPNPYWRTFQIEAVGDWVKIEFLPARNRPFAVSPPYYNASQVVPQNTNLITNTDQYYGNATYFASGAQVMLDFENVSEAPHIVKNGSEFFGYFTNLVLSFKQMNCMIRVTVGFNSRISEPDRKDSGLAFIGDRGLVNAPRLNPTPFSISHRDSSNAIEQTQGIIPDALGNPRVVPLVFNNQVSTVFSSVSDGIASLYITSFRALVYPITNTPTDFTFSYDVELIQYKLDPAFATALYSIKRLATLSCFGVTTVLANTAQTSATELSAQISDPIRVSLRQNEALCLRLIPSILALPADTYYRVKFAVDGYTFGSFRASNPASTVPFLPLRTGIVFQDHPFPCDSDTVALPRR